MKLTARVGETAKRGRKPSIGMLGYPLNKLGAGGVSEKLTIVIPEGMPLAWLSGIHFKRQFFQKRRI